MLTYVVVSDPDDACDKVTCVSRDVSVAGSLGRIPRSVETRTRVCVTVRSVSEGTPAPRQVRGPASPDARSDVEAREEGVWARRVRERRQALRLSQLELGQLAGLTQQAVSYIERGAGIPRVTTMVRVARSLGMTVEQLVCVVGEDARPGTDATGKSTGEVEGTPAGGRGPEVSPVSRSS